MAATRVPGSWALMAFFEDEPGADKVEALLLEAEQGGARLWMSVVNWGEVWYSIARRQGAKAADQLTGDIGKMAIEVVDADRTITRIAAEFKAKYKMGYADCFAAALAKDQKAELVTGDKDFRQVEKQIKVSWL